MPIASAPIDLDTLRAALEAAREELMASFHVKQEADRRYMEAFAAYERAADTLRRGLAAADQPPQEPGLGKFPHQKVKSMT